MSEVGEGIGESDEVESGSEGLIQRGLGAGSDRAQEGLELTE